MSVNSLYSSEIHCTDSNSQLLLEIRRQLQDVQKDVSEIKGLLVSLLRNEEPTLDTLFAAQRISFPTIPDEIAGKFTIWLAMNPPDDFRDVSSIPLKEGFDALVYHFAQVRYQHGLGWQRGSPYIDEDMDCITFFRILVDLGQY